MREGKHNERTAATSRQVDTAFGGDVGAVRLQQSAPATNPNTDTNRPGNPYTGRSANLRSTGYGHSAADQRPSHYAARNCHSATNPYHSPRHHRHVSADCSYRHPAPTNAPTRYRNFIAADQQAAASDGYATAASDEHASAASDEYASAIDRYTDHHYRHADRANQNAAAQRHPHAGVQRADHRPAQRY